MKGKTLMEIQDILSSDQQARESLVRADSDGILLRAGKYYEYPIEFDRCDTPARILSWCLHLSRKNWATADMLGDFIEQACSANKVSIDWTR